MVGKVISTQIHQVIPADNKLFIATIEGDVVDIQVDLPNKSTVQTRNNNITCL